MKKSLLFILFSSAFSLQAQTIELVSNANPSGGADPYRLKEFNGHLYYICNDGTHGAELWKTDGTSSGTSMVLDINAAGDASINFLTPFNGYLYFSANDGINGAELWRTDGTVAGTTMVVDLNPGPAGSDPYFLTAGNGLLYFSAGGLTGAELYATDGTSGGTQLVKDINPSGSSDPQQLVFVNNHLYFVADDGTSGNELWISDGTSGGTYLLNDLWPSGGSSPSLLTPCNGSLYFRAYDGSRTELYVYDFNTTYTKLTSQTPVAYAPMSLLALSNKLLFAYNDSVHGVELWATDGTVAGTTLISDIYPGNTGSWPSTYIVYNGSGYFIAEDPVNSVELWKSDGTAAGTVMVKNIHPSSYSLPDGLVEYNGNLFFSADDGTHGRELWKSNGTNAGTQKVTVPAWATFSNPLPAGIPMVVAGNDLFFRANYNTDGSELYKYYEPMAGIIETENISQLLLYPNPSAGVSTLQIDLKEQGNLQLSVCDVNGKILFSRVYGDVCAGKNIIQITDGNYLPPGAYWVMGETGGDRFCLQWLVE